MKKAVKIVLGVLGALGLGLIGLILACHFKPGLSDAIADKLYKNRSKNEAQATLSEEEEAELDRITPDDLAGNGSGEEESAADPEEVPDLPGPDEPQSAEEPAEEAAPPAPLKTLADYGLSQENVLNNIDEYFDDCYEQLSAAKGNDTSFYNVMRDSMLGQKVLQSYDDESYREGFMNKFMDDYKVESCGWSIDEEELEGGYILVKHTFTR